MRLSELAAIWRNRARVHDVVGINRRNVELVYANNRRSDYPLVDDKIVCKALMEAAGVPVPKTIAVCEGLFDVPRVESVVRELSQFVVKPASGSGGDGILVLGDRTATGWKTAGGRDLSFDELRQHLAEIVFGAYSKNMDDRGLVEERIIPHPLFVEFYPTGLSDIRLIFLRGRLLMSMVRVPTNSTGGRANLHQGGVGVAVDIETGVTTRAVALGVPIAEHPDTRAPLVGRQIPDWEHIVEVGRRCAGCVPLGYIGVDIVIDATRGAMVLEMNARPGLEIQNINGFPMGPLLVGESEQ